MHETHPYVADLLVQARLSDALERQVKAARLRESKSGTAEAGVVRKTVGSAMMRAGSWVAGEPRRGYGDYGQQLAMDC
ncbi:MAG TPA: hypothetical protein VFI42_07975 [Thermomicrobiaceae bacterium]|nr:hypothetical protein [Thermomicrobiaceae bacterium]